MKHVLLFEDEVLKSRHIVYGLEQANYKVTLVESLPQNPTDPEFKDLLAKASTFDLVIWDAMIAVAGRQSMYQVNTANDGFIAAFKKVFPGPMIANSSHEGWRTKQMAAGCTDFSKVDNKYDMSPLIGQVKELLG